jgi:hypothetical protein
MMFYNGSPRILEKTTLNTTKVKRKTKPTVWIDPPEGWIYGFPRPIPEGIEGDAINEWMIKVGYPKEKIEEYGEHFHCRMMYEEKNEA